jgi:hypothetical protein
MRVSPTDLCLIRKLHVSVEVDEINAIKFVSQFRFTQKNQYKNLKRELKKCKANVYFKRGCLRGKITDKCRKIKF